MRFTAFFAYFFVLHLCGGLLFTAGFFLTRFEILDKSECKTSPVQNDINFSSNGIDSCWYPRKFKRAVVIVIDALRFDYVAHFDNVESYNKNKLPIIQHLLQKEPENSLLYQFRADPPSVTMQRLKGLTTGGMPTFIDVLKNFHGTEIEEDNIIQQFIENNRSLTFMGDDTWESLFPKVFRRSFPYPSFNVKDLHTVDDGVLSHLIPEITGPEKWDVLIAHFLGVDHVGHRYESNHPAMSEKLGQMNKMIEEVVAVLGNDTILFVLGDHGSTDDGNHGGATEEELNAGLFIYSGHPIFPPHLSSIRTVAQVDLVPTLSMLLGAPIPFSNIGVVIRELFLSSGIESMIEYSKILRLNCWQIYNYLKSYSEISGGFPESKMQEIEDLFLEANFQFERVQKGEINLASQVATKFEQFQSEVVRMCQDLWVSFDVSSMTWGLLIWILALVLQSSCFLLQNISFPSLNTGVGAIIGSLITVLLQIGPASQYQWVRLCLGGALGSSLGFMQGIRPHLRLPRLSSITIEGMFAGIFVILHGLSLFSNSYIEAQNKVIYFLSASSWGILVPKIIRPPKSSITTYILWIVVALCIRLSQEVPSAIYEGSELTLLSFLFLSVLPIGILYFGIFHYLREVLSPALQIYVQLSCVSLLIFSIFQKTGVADAAPSIRNSFPWVIYLGAAVSLFTLKSSNPNFARKFTEVSNLFVVILLFPISLVLGLTGTTYMLLFAIQMVAFIEVLYSTNNSFPIYSVVPFAIFSLQYFFATGHGYDVNKLHFAAAFVGFEEASYIGGAALMALEALFPFLLVAFLIPSIVAYIGKPTNFEPFFKPLLAFMSFFTYSLVLSAIFVFTQRRHLMVWRVFAPKYLFEVSIALVVDLTVIGSWLFHKCKR